MVNSVVERPRKQRQSVTLELGSIEGITLTCVVLDPLFPIPFNIGREKDRYQRKGTQVECP